MGKRRKTKKKLPPEFLISTDDYLEAPVGTIVAAEGAPPIWKSCTDDDCPDEWEGIGYDSPYSSGQVAGVVRNVLRWGWVPNGQAA